MTTLTLEVATRYTSLSRARGLAASAAAAGFCRSGMGRAPREGGEGERCGDGSEIVVRSRAVGGEMGEPP